MKRKKPKMGIGTGISNPAGLKIFTWLILGLILVSVGLALPVPHGIDGKIYELDGITEVPAGTQFSVLNMNNGLAVFGTTGHVGTGGFSASLKGEDGDTIVVKAWNLYNEVELTLALAGVLHNVNLYLNMTYPAMPPNITSAPGTEATQGVPYSYQVTAVDGNNDNLDYGLAIWPEGMSINSGTGLITWTPQNEDVGVNFVSVYVNDGTYTVYQNFSITVANVNDVPVITSLPVLTATEKASYLYDANAADPDNDTLFYALMQNPPGMSINQQTGLINWTPNQSHIGQQGISIRVSDGLVGADQNFTIDVSNVNDLPVITSLPVTEGTQDMAYAYDVEASDIDNDALAYSLLESPPGMAINGTNGIISWLPDNGQVGTHNITVSVMDDNGSTSQEFALIIANVNDAPAIISSPITIIKSGQTYLYDVDAVDIDGDAILYSIVQGPAGMSIDSANGLITWKTKRSVEGVYLIIVRASDGSLIDLQEYNLTVSKKPDQTAGSSSTLPRRILFQSSSLSDTVILVQAAEAMGTVEIQPIEMSTRTAGTEPLQLRAYKYFVLEHAEPAEDGFVQIRFKIERQWMDSREIKYSDMVLYVFEDGKWLELPTQFAETDGTFAYYDATSSGFGNFAIALREGVPVKDIDAAQSSGLKTPFRISGIIYYNDKTQVPPGTEFEIRNIDTGETVKGHTGVGPYSGLYAVNMHGKFGDRLLVTIQGSAQVFEATMQDLDSFDFVIDKRTGGLSQITGYAARGKGLQSQALTVLWMLIVGFIVVYIGLMAYNKLKKL